MKEILHSQLRILLVGVALQLIEGVIETNLIRVIAYPVTFTVIVRHLKQLYLSNKMEHFSYKGGCGVCVLRHLKESWLWLLINGFVL